MVTVVNLTTLRERAGLNKQELARAAKLSPATITLIEQGRRGVSVDSLCAIANILCCSTDELLGKYNNTLT